MVVGEFKYQYSLLPGLPSLTFHRQNSSKFLTPFEHLHSSRERERNSEFKDIYDKQWRNVIKMITMNVKKSYYIRKFIRKILNDICGNISIVLHLIDKITLIFSFDQVRLSTSLESPRGTVKRRKGAQAKNNHFLLQQLD